MHALTRFETVYGSPARRPLPEIRLRPFVYPPALVPALRRATQIGMGAGLGAVLGAVCGNPVFWIGLGAALGIALGAVALAPRQVLAIEPGVYPIPQA
jgi:hypothetical protein